MEYDHDDAARCRTALPASGQRRRPDDPGGGAGGVYADAGGVGVVNDVRTHPIWWACVGAPGNSSTT